MEDRELRMLTGSTPAAGRRAGGGKDLVRDASVVIGEGGSGGQIARPTAVLAVEAVAAACLALSLVAGRPVTVRTGPTVMTGLNCGTPSTLAWSLIEPGLDAVAAVTDAEDLRAARDLALLGINAGPCGAAALAAARLALTGPGSLESRAHLGIGPHSIAVLICTEGTDANPLPDTS